MHRIRAWPAAAGLALALLAAACARPAPTIAYLLPVSVVVFEGAEWSADGIDDAIADANSVLGACGVALAPGEARRLQGEHGADWSAASDELDRAAALGPEGESGAVLVFVRAIREPGDRPAILARALPATAPETIVVARDGAAALAHEVGHVLGLGHVTDGRIDRMAPTGCRLCLFTEAQCAAMRRSPRLMPAKR